MMSQRDDKDGEEFSNWAKTVLGLKKARDGSINHIKSKIQPFVDKLDSKHSSNESVHFKELLIKVAVNAEVNILPLGRKNATKFKWVLDNNTCTTCEKIFEEQIDILEKSLCFCKKWPISSTKEQVERSSYWWILAKMYMIKSKVDKAVGPEEVEQLAIFNLIKFCKLFDSNLRSDVDNIVQLRHRLMHSANNRLTEKEMNDNFGLIKKFLQQVATDTDTLDDVGKLETSTLVLYDENGEFSEKIKEALQQQDISLNADLKLPKGIRGAAITSLAASNMTIKQQKMKLEESEKEHKVKYEELLKQKEQLEMKLTESEKYTNQYEELIKLLKMKGEVDDLKQEKSKHEKEILSLKSTVLHTQKNINDLKQEKSKHDKEISSLKSTMDKEINDLKQEKDKMGKEIMIVKQGKSQQDGVISSLELTMKGEVDELKQEKSKHDKEISSLMSTVLHTKENIDSLKKEKSKHDKEISSLKSTKLQMEKEINDLKKEKSKQDGVISSLKSTTEENINDLKQEKSKQDEEISSLKSEMNGDIDDLKQEKDKEILSLKSTLSINQTYQVQPANDVIVRVDSDEEECYLRDMCQMSDGTVILLDFFNSKLKRLDDKFNVKDVYKFDTRPISVVSVSSLQVVVLDESGKLTYLTIMDNVVQEKSVALEEVKNARCMIYCRDQFWIVCMDGIRLYSFSGSLVKQISNNVSQPPLLGFYSLTTNEEKTRVYFVRGSTVKVLDPNGEILYSFKLRNNARAITFTTDDKLLVIESISYESSNVVVYDTAGNNLGALIFGKSLLSTPNSLLYDGKKGCLIVGFVQENKIQVFQLNN